ncbi:hypothetical protein ABZ847_17200 [Streptomyces bauhiniae]
MNAWVPYLILLGGLAVVLGALTWLARPVGSPDGPRGGSRWTR